MGEAMPDEAFEALLNYLKRSRGFDFTGYKRPSLMRLMKKRMAKVKVESYGEYLDFLQVNSVELTYLLDALLLNVTTFFRDASAWQSLAKEIIPRILDVKAENEPIRVWSAGCASGEEAYTLAIILAEALGIEEFKTRVKIYATDVDEDTLTQGRLASYAARVVRNVPEELRGRYFDTARTVYSFRNELRRAIIFGRHDLVQDAPISRLDLLVCRNTLMYFNAETQSRILARFHFALKDTGFLFVGKAEMLLTHTNLFTPVQLKYRIFSKVPKVSLRDRLQVIAEAENTVVANHLIENMRLRDEAFECLSVAQIIVDIQGNLILANRQARSLFNLSSNDLGRPFQDLELSYRPAELRSPIQQVYAERRPLQLTNVEFPTLSKSNILYLDIEIIPLLGSNTEVLGVTVIFNDSTRTNLLERELQRFTQELETAYEELQCTNEELETTNEELQSTNEELETTNEELQSTNEELETMNEELQSSNEELQATNEELRDRTVQLNHVNAFMESILTSIRVGMVVLDSRLSIQLWNGRAVELWGLRMEEIQGHFFFDLDIGLPVEQLRIPIRSCQAGTSDYEELELEAVNRRGKTIRCRVICTPLIVEKLRQGIILLMEEGEVLGQ